MGATPDICTIDLLYRGLAESIAAYLLIGPEGPVLIETGPGSTIDALVDGLAEHGIAPRDIRHVLVTHIHFDHAGAAGWLARQGATVYVHEVGAPHLVDPSKLVASARRIYGDQMEALWGELIPIAKNQVTPVRHGDVLDVAGLRIEAIDTPGHAGHHHSFALRTDQGDICFVGDAAGVVVPGSQYIAVPAPPPEFDLRAWDQSITRLESRGFDAIYPTHFGRIDHVAKHLTEFRRTLHEHANYIRDAMKADRDYEDIHRSYAQWARDLAAEAGVRAEVIPGVLTVNFIRMSVDGMIRYWTKHAEAIEPS